MAYHVIQDFRAGMDVTRPAYMSQDGTLQRLTNAHLTRGGDIEKRKAFVAKYALPANTHGLASVGGALYVFGSVVAPAMPAGVLYQRLQNGAKVMQEVLMAEAFNGKLYVVVQWTDTTVSHFYDGTLVAAFFDGRARATFTVNGGALVTDEVTSIRVNGVEILNTTIGWATSHDATATAIAAGINAFGSTPEYTATASGATVYIEATAAVGSGANGFAVAVTVTNNMSVTVPTAMSGGQAPGATYTPGQAVRTFKSKLYSTSGSNLHASAIDTPTDWNTTANGAWFVNLSNYASGAQALVAMAKYYDQLAVFSNDTTLLWEVLSDPAENRQTQEVPDIGCIGRKAATTYRDGAVYFLSDQGVKSLQARDASNYAEVVDASLAIDPILTADIQAASATVKAQAILLVDPEEGRLWCILGTSIFVLSAYPRAKIRAWSEYTPGFQITATAIKERRLYCRSGATVYLFGGDDNATYDNSTVELILPYVTLRAPATMKQLYAIDVGLDGSWDIYGRPEPDSDDEDTLALDYNGVSFDKPAIGVAQRSTHLSLRLLHNTAEYARLSSVALHYRQDESR
jgi:hypothetical protein